MCLFLISMVAIDVCQMYCFSQLQLFLCRFIYRENTSNLLMEFIVKSNVFSNALIFTIAFILMRPFLLSIVAINVCQIYLCICYSPKVRFL